MKIIGYRLETENSCNFLKLQTIKSRQYHDELDRFEFGFCRTI